MTPTGPLRVTNVDALMPTVLEDIGIAELPELIVAEYLADGRMEAILTDWTLPRGALYFVTPSARARPAKVEALADFLASRQSRHETPAFWRALSFRRYAFRFDHFASVELMDDRYPGRPCL